jgi:NAD-dependent dihydropyrimidine dehydrogenase PreA subunit
LNILLFCWIWIIKRSNKCSINNTIIAYIRAVVTKAWIRIFLCFESHGRNHQKCYDNTPHSKHQIYKMDSWFHLFNILRNRMLGIRANICTYCSIQTNFIKYTLYDSDTFFGNVFCIFCCSVEYEYLNVQKNIWSISESLSVFGPW